MTSMIGKMRDALRRDRGVDADRLLARIEALDRFLRAVEDHLPDSRLVAARTVVERADARLARSRNHTVVALVGATGGGKSSLFNALARHDLSPVGVRRPTTGDTHACVWGSPSGATELLDWIGVLPRHRFVRDPDDDEAGLHGLVLLDLPDFDSVEAAHQAEVDRLLGLVDMMVWVVDPQKYADRVVHRDYLQECRRHKDVSVVVLNQADLLAPADLPRVLADVRRLLDEDGLEGVPLLATSVYDPASVANLRSTLEGAVAGRQAALRRLAADVNAVAEDLSELVGPAIDGTVDAETERRLADALATSAGVPAVVEAVELAYRHRAATQTGWPLLRGFRRLRPDPLRRLHLTDGASATEASAESVAAATSVPAPTPAQRSAAGLAVRAVAEQAGAGLPELWRTAVTTAACSRLGDLPDALDRALATTDLGLDRPRSWWRLVKAAQTLITAAAVVGLGWLVIGYLVRLIGLPPLEYPMVGRVPLPTLMLLGGLVGGLPVAALVRPAVSAGARRARRRAEQRLRAAVADVAHAYVVEPVCDVLRSYAEARAALDDLTSAR